MSSKSSTWETIYYHFGLYIITLKSEVYVKCVVENSFCSGTWGEMTPGTLRGSAFETATAPSCLITLCPCPVCCCWSSEQHCSISIRWSLPPRLQPLCLWKWYSAGMPPACQDVTVFPHRLHLCSCTSMFVLGEGCRNWLTSFIYN